MLARLIAGNKKGANIGRDDSTKNVSPLKAFSLPKAESRMDDKIAQARGATGPFQYVSVVGYSKLSKSARLDRLFSSRPQVSTKEIPFDKIKPLDLVDRRYEISFKDTVGPTFLKNSENWIHVSELSCAYSPGTDVYDLAGDIMIGILDDRRIEDKLAKSQTWNASMSALIDMPLSFCFHKDDSGDVKILVVLSNSNLKVGVKWGSLSVRMTLTTSNTARPVAFESAIGVMEIPQTIMAEHKTNPAHNNMVIDNDDLKAIRKMHRSGRIMDRSRPANKQNIAQFTGSEAGSDDRGSVEDIKPSTSSKIEKWAGKVQSDHDSVGSSEYWRKSRQEFLEKARGDQHVDIRQVGPDEGSVIGAQLEGEEADDQDEADHVEETPVKLDTTTSIKGKEREVKATRFPKSVMFSRPV